MGEQKAAEQGQSSTVVVILSQTYRMDLRSNKPDGHHKEAPTKDVPVQIGLLPPIAFLPHRPAKVYDVDRGFLIGHIYEQRLSKMHESRR